MPPRSGADRPETRRRSGSSGNRVVSPERPSLEPLALLLMEKQYGGSETSSGSMPDLPTGTVTFLFSDIEGSTRLLAEFGDDYERALQHHRDNLREAFGRCGGIEVDTQGDAFFYAFARAGDAVAAAAAGQRALADDMVRVRIGLHTGEPRLGDEGYIGIDVHRAARICSAGHGGQVLLSHATRELLVDRLDADIALRDLGVHRLKDLAVPERLYQLVIAGVESEFPALRTLANRPTNLPAQPTPIIGRQHELERAGDILSRDDVRLLTLTGPGGIGKTRLALQLAGDLLDQFPDGVFFVNLAAIADPKHVVAAIAKTLAVGELAGRSLDETVAEYLRGRQLLLLLDNFEHLLAAGPSLADLLAAAPELRLLVTSRAALNLAAEHEYVVPPLELPDFEHFSDVAALSRYEAVILFAERARAVRPNFEVTKENASAVAEICIRLDGLPLAIELAAARLRALPPQALLERLEQRLSLLIGGASDAPARQRTLRATIDWSYALLNQDEQRLLTRLSVFAGGLDLEAAEAVCNIEGLPEIEVFEGISSLIEKSLLRAEDNIRSEPRYSMLESIREYAREKLEAGGEAEALRESHASHFCVLSERAERTMTGEEIAVSDAPEERVQNELPNLRVAMQSALDESDSELALRLAASAWVAWGLSGAISEGRRWVTRILDETDHLQTADRARAQSGLARLATEEGDFQGAEVLLEQALKLFRHHNDCRRIVQTLAAIAEIAAIMGKIERSWAILDEARGLVKGHGDDYLRGELCLVGAIVQGLSANYERALDLLDEGLAHWVKLGVPRRLWSHQLINVGWLAMERHDFRRAKVALEDYLAGASLKNHPGIANAHCNLGLVALYEGNRNEAESRFRQSLALAHGLGTKPTIAENLFGLAAVAALDGEGERATRLFAAANLMTNAMGAPLSGPVRFIVERYLEPAEAELAAGLRTRARSEGNSMTIDEAVDHALASESPSR
jgi:predicted ATPase/class 3 adenylate cyclase